MGVIEEKKQAKADPSSTSRGRTCSLSPLLSLLGSLRLDWTSWKFPAPHTTFLGNLVTEGLLESYHKASFTIFTNLKLR